MRRGARSVAVKAPRVRNASEFLSKGVKKVQQQKDAVKTVPTNPVGRMPQSLAKNNNQVVTPRAPQDSADTFHFKPERGQEMPRDLKLLAAQAMLTVGGFDVFG